MFISKKGINLRRKMDVRVCAKGQDEARAAEPKKDKQQPKKEAAPAEAKADAAK